MLRVLNYSQKIRNHSFWCSGKVMSRGFDGAGFESCDEPFPFFPSVFFCFVLFCFSFLFFNSNKFHKTKTAATCSHRTMVPGLNLAKYPLFFSLSFISLFFFFVFTLCSVFFFNINVNKCYFT